MLVKEKFKGKVSIVTGGGGLLGGAMAEVFVSGGAYVILLGRNRQSLENKKAELLSRYPDQCIETMACDVLEKGDLKIVKNQIVSQFGTIDILVNAAGGNQDGATIKPGQSFKDLDSVAFEQVNKLNLMGTVLPSLVFGEVMAENKQGVILNISSVTADRAVTRVIGYSAAKAAVENFTKSLAVEMAHKFGDKIRVNAITPGFFIAEQNRKLLLNDDGSYTERAKTILNSTPMKRFGEKEEIQGVVSFLCSDEASFITGAVIPVDGGFLAYSGV